MPPLTHSDIFLAEVTIMTCIFRNLPPLESATLGSHLKPALLMAWWNPMNKKKIAMTSALNFGWYSFSLCVLLGFQHLHRWRFCFHHYNADGPSSGLLPRRCHLCHLPVPDMVCIIYIHLILIILCMFGSLISLSGSLRKSNFLLCRYLNCLIVLH